MPEIDGEAATTDAPYDGIDRRPLGERDDRCTRRERQRQPGGPDEEMQDVTVVDHAVLWWRRDRPTDTHHGRQHREPSAARRRHRPAAEMRDAEREERRVQGVVAELPQEIRRPRWMPVGAQLG